MCECVCCSVAAAFKQPSVYVARANTVSFRATNGVEESTVVCVHASPDIPRLKSPDS